jgi:hypothetical protein
MSEEKGKPWETTPVITRKPRQGRHFGLTRTNVAHYPILRNNLVRQRNLAAFSPLAPRRAGIRLNAEWNLTRWFSCHIVRRKPDLEKVNCGQKRARRRGFINAVGYRIGRLTPIVSYEC